MSNRTISVALAVSACLSAACAEGGVPAEAPGVAISVAPLSLPGVTDATYTLTVANHHGDTVIARQLTASVYGDGAGSLSYVAPCDATDNDNTVTVHVDELRGPGGALIAPATWRNPGDLVRTFRCDPNADVAVAFDITIARDASQGFFDVAVEFDDVFCSAKLDCVDEGGGELALLHDGAERGRTAVVGLVCTGGDAGGETTLYRTALTVACGASGTAVVDPSAGPGNLAFGAGISGTDGLLFGAAVYAGVQELGYATRYWNVLLGLGANAKGCTLTASATATSGALDGGATPAGSTWPAITWNVPLTDGAGGRLCGHHPLDGAGAEAGVATGYATTSVTYPYSYPSAGGGTTPPPTPVGGRSCKAILAADAAAPSAVYVIDPDDEGPIAPFEAWCDMTPGDGGWTYGLIVNTDTDTAGKTRVAGYTAFGAAAGPILGTEYGVDLTGVSFSEVRVANFTTAQDLTRDVASGSTWGGGLYDGETGYAAMRVPLANGGTLRAGYYGTVSPACVTAPNIPVCIAASTVPVGWVCDSDTYSAQGFLDCTGGEICGVGYYFAKEVWRVEGATPQCTIYAGAPTPAVYGLAIR